jgi:hypothetical protein
MTLEEIDLLDSCVDEDFRTLKAGLEGGITSRIQSADSLPGCCDDGVLLGMNRPNTRAIMLPTVYLGLVAMVASRGRAVEAHRYQPIVFDQHRTDPMAIACTHMLDNPSHIHPGLMPFPISFIQTH